MADRTAIEWTDATWNPITGCSKVSAGCANCYAERMHRRLEAMGQQKYRQGFNAVRFHGQELYRPLGWRKPRRIFVCSMSDLFHKNVSREQVVEILEVCRQADWHTFQLLTKRPRHAFDLHLSWPPNVWLGVSVEDQDAARTRLPMLDIIPVHKRFISFEPLLEYVSVPWTLVARFDWVIVGGETGPGYRPMDPHWARYLLNVSRACHVPFFMKQMAGRAHVPTDLQVREFPC